MRKTKVRYLSQEDILSLQITSTQTVNIIETALFQHGNRKVQMPPKPAIFPRPGCYDYLHAMPAYIRGMDICGLKWLARSSDNPKLRNLPQFTGLQIINNPENGLPLCIMDCRWITVARTAAVSVLTTRYAQAQGTETLSILGTGLQGRFHALMLAQELPHIKDIFVYNRSQASLKNFVEQISSCLPHVKVRATTSQEAVSQADLVVLCGVNGHFIRNEWLRPYSLCISINLAQALAPDVITHIERIFTDDQRQFWDRFATEPDAFSGKPSLDGELSELLLGSKKPRAKESDRVLSMNLGMAICDLALGNLIYEEALRQDVGLDLPLFCKEDLSPLIG